MENKTINPKLAQKQIPKALAYSDSTLERYRSDMKIISSNESSEDQTGLQRPQKTSKELKKQSEVNSSDPMIANSTSQARSKKETVQNKKSKLKGGNVNGNSVPGIAHFEQAFLIELNTMRV